MQLHSNILGKGKPFVILHGFLGMGDNWKSLANKFSENNEVHVVDQRNHGRSFHDEDFSYELMVEDLLYYLDYHELKSVQILGHSMGGYVSLAFLEKYSSKINTIVLLNSTTEEDSLMRKKNRERMLKIIHTNKNVFVR